MKWLLRLLSLPCVLLWVGVGYYLDLARGWPDPAITAVVVPLLLGGVCVAVVLWGVSSDAPARIPLPSRRQYRLDRVLSHRERLRDEFARMPEDDPERAHVEGQVEELNAVEAAILSEKARVRRSALSRTTRKIVDRETRS